MKEVEDDYDPCKADSDGGIDEEAMRVADEREDWYRIRDVDREYREVVAFDDKESFLDLIARSDRDFFAVKGYFRPSRLQLICEASAFVIAKALLQGETGWKVDLNASCGDGTYPLHKAASSFSCEFLELLIAHGARTDVRTTGPHVVGGLLPLNAAVEDTCLHEYLECWTKKDSAFKLIVLLSLREMKLFLDCIGLLAQHTNHTFDELLNYIEQGKLLQMTVLLIAARKQIMSTAHQDKDGKSISAMEVILRKIDDALIFLMQEVEEIPNKPKNGLAVSKCKAKAKAMAFARLIFQLIGRIGDSLDEFRQTLHSEVSHKVVIEYVAFLLAREGFSLNEKDIDFQNVYWYRCPTNERVEISELSKRSVSLYPPQPDSFHLVQQPDMAFCNDTEIQTSRLLQCSYVRRLIPYENSVTTFRLFTSRSNYENGSIMGYDGLKKKRRAKQAVRPLPQIESGTKGIVLPLPSYQPSKQYSTVASLILRAIRRV